jgi:hypothetical protein
MAGISGLDDRFAMMALACALAQQSEVDVSEKYLFFPGIS